MLNNKIAIIGGAGFVGSKLTKLLKRLNKSHAIFDINNSKNKEGLINIDVTDATTLDKLSGYDSLINLAAEHRDDIKPASRYDDVNVNGANNVCNAARKFNINSIIFTSSVAIYGFAEPDTDEEGEPKYFNDYGRTKYLAEQVYKRWQAEDKENRTLVIIRPTVIFGESNRGNVYNLLNQIASKKFAMFGNGQNIKSMAYVENVVAFINYSLNFKPGLHIYNYIDTPDINMNTLVAKVRGALFQKNNVGIRIPAFIGIAIGYFADIIAKFTGKTFPISSIRVEKFLKTTKFSSAIKNTDFVPPFSLEDGLKKTLQYEFLEDNSDEPIFYSE